MVRKLMNSAEATHYAEISGGIKRNCFGSYLPNDLENSLPDLTICINKFCCIWKEPGGNEAFPEYWQCLQGYNSRTNVFIVQRVCVVSV